MRGGGGRRGGSEGGGLTAAAGIAALRGRRYVHLQQKGCIALLLRRVIALQATIPASKSARFRFVAGSDGGEPTLLFGYGGRAGAAECIAEQPSGARSTYLSDEGADTATANMDPLYSSSSLLKLTGAAGPREA